MKTNGKLSIFGKPILSPGLCVVCLLLFSACGPSNHSENRIPGYLECDWVLISSPRSGELVERPVRRGDPVNTGDRIGRLDGTIEKAQLAEIEARVSAARHRLTDAKLGDRPENLAIIEAQVAEASATYSYAKAEFERTQTLFNEAAISERELNRATSDFSRSQEALRTLENRLAAAKIGQRPDAVKSLESEVDALMQQKATLEWHLKQTDVLSPDEGWIQETYAEPGEWIGAGKPLFMIRPKGRLNVRFYAPDHMVPQFALGTTIRFHLSGEPEPVPAEVRYISTKPEHTPPVLYSRTSQDSLVFMIEASLSSTDADRLNPGAAVEVEVRSASQSSRD